MSGKNSPKLNKSLVPSERIISRIFLSRGKKVMIDVHLAELYGVETKVLIQSIKRNKDRFPVDFMFQLTKEEFADLRSQIVTSSWGGRRYAPYVFTEQGVAMLSSVLKSKRAVQVNILIMRTFTKLREMLLSHVDLQRKIEKLEKKYKDHDQQFKMVFEAIKQMIKTEDQPGPKIGFKA